MSLHPRYHVTRENTTDDKHNWQHLKSERQAETYVLLYLLESCLSAHWGNKSHTSNLCLKDVCESHIFHKHYLLVTVSGLGQRPWCWLSNIGCKPDVSRAMGHIFKNTWSISDDLICWVYWVWNCFSTNLIKKKSPEGKYSRRDWGSETEAVEA